MRCNVCGKQGGNSCCGCPRRGSEKGIECWSPPPPGWEKMLPTEMTLFPGTLSSESCHFRLAPGRDLAFVDSCGLAKHIFVVCAAPIPLGIRAHDLSIPLSFPIRCATPGFHGQACQLCLLCLCPILFPPLLLPCRVTFYGRSATRPNQSTNLARQASHIHNVSVLGQIADRNLASHLASHHLGRC